MPTHEIDQSLYKLEKNRTIERASDRDIYIVNSDYSSELRKKVIDTEALEETVKTEWLDTLNDVKDDIKRSLWQCLQQYLSAAFRRHGVQSVALLDPTIEVAPEYTESLSQILNSAVKDHFDPPDGAEVKSYIRKFLAESGGNLKRATYISQLADAAFNFFSLTVPTDTANLIRSNLLDLVIFLDTNFIFGILDLHSNPYVDVSTELIDVISKYRFPFKLRYHEETKNELTHSIDNYKRFLTAKQWPKPLSRAIVKSRCTSGVEVKFHELNAKEGISVEAFIKQYEHFDILLKAKDIQIYRTKSKRNDIVNDLHHDYKIFLERHGKDKPYETIAHDVTVLDSVRLLRSNAPSTLEAGAVFLTCDYLLYKFDWECSRKNGHKHCCIMPNHFWQIIKRFVPNDASFDKTFAETFALPEFRSFSTGASRACYKMINIMAGVKNFSEETATKILSNDLIMDSLSTASDEEILEAFESEVANINANLEEQISVLSSSLAKVGEERSLEYHKQEQEKSHLQNSFLSLKNDTENTIKKYETDISSMSSELAKYKSLLAEKDASLEQTKITLSENNLGLKEIEKKFEDIQKTATSLQASIEKYKIVIFIILACLLALSVNIVMEMLGLSTRWPFVANPAFVPALDLLIFLLFVGYFNPKYRKRLWGTSSIVAIILFLISLSGNSPGVK